MKKFIFSAIAMIAFVGSSMANDIVKKTILINDLTEFVLATDFVSTQNVLLEEVSCSEGANNVYNYLREEMDLTHAQAWRLSSIAYNRCMKERYGSPGFAIKNEISE